MNNFYEFCTNKHIQKLADQANLDISQFSDDELRMGYEDEKEHDGGEGKDVDVVGPETDIIKIVVAHLREDPRYYSKIKKVI